MLGIFDNVLIIAGIVCGFFFFIHVLKTTIWK
jgi:hypothetical protein